MQDRGRICFRGVDVPRCFISSIDSRAGTTVRLSFKFLSTGC